MGTPVVLLIFPSLDKGATSSAGSTRVALGPERLTAARSPTVPFLSHGWEQL
jgi:hypothetical protein